MSSVIGAGSAPGRAAGESISAAAPTPNARRQTLDIAYATLTIAPTADATTYASQTFPLDDPGGMHKVYLVFRPVAGGPGNNFFNLNWVEFGGQGISVPSAATATNASGEAEKGGRT